MFDALWLFALALGCVTIGLARIAVWLIDRREQDKTRVIRDAAFAAKASAEVRRG